MKTDYLVVNLDIKYEKLMKESILLPGPDVLADSQVYLAILVALSCPFYVLLGMSAAITLPSNPPYIYGAGGWGEGGC